MVARVKTGSLLGLEAAEVTAEVDLAGGLPGFAIVGLPDKAVEEAKERVKAAIKNSGLPFPGKKIIVNLAPADLRKEGPAFDLPIAIGVLAAAGIIELPKETLFFGELALDGEVRGVAGALALTSLAKAKGYQAVFLPRSNAQEASLIEGLDIFPVQELRELVLHLKRERLLLPLQGSFLSQRFSEEREGDFDLAEIAGQEHAKRALEIAAAGGHNLLMTGPPGGGKTMLARTLPSILPSMTQGEILEVTKIYSAAGLLNADHPLKQSRPFRSPHHTASQIALVGGGNSPKPGEVTLAHRGVLFLDELPEFPRSVLEALRQPLEDGQVTIARASGSLTFPARFMFVAAQNPCPCGFAGDPERPCHCSPGEIMRYRKRVSGPLLDRLDLHLTLPRLRSLSLKGERSSESSATVRQRVETAHRIQLTRLGRRKTNAAMTNKEIRLFCPLTNESEELISAALTKFSLSARGYTKVLKVALTIADLNHAAKIEPEHLAEALQYRWQPTIE